MAHALYNGRSGRLLVELGHKRMRVIGIDPGTIVTGWGIITVDGSRLSYVASGVVKVGRGEVAGRLAEIYKRLGEIAETYEPEKCSLERNFLARNVQSAFRLGEARGVVMAVMAAGDIPIIEYTPATIKKSVVGHGRAAKGTMQAGIQRLFAMPHEPAEDEADALAAAACFGLRRLYDDRIVVSTETEPRAQAGPSRLDREIREALGETARRSRRGDRDAHGDVGDASAKPGTSKPELPVRGAKPALRPRTVPAVTKSAVSAKTPDSRSRRGSK